MSRFMYIAAWRLPYTANGTVLTPTSQHAEQARSIVRERLQHLAANGSADDVQYLCDQANIWVEDTEAGAEPDADRARLAQRLLDALDTVWHARAEVCILAGLMLSGGDSYGAAPNDESTALALLTEAGVTDTPIDLGDAPGQQPPTARTVGELIAALKHLEPATRVFLGAAHQPADPAGQPTPGIRLDAVVASTP